MISDPRRRPRPRLAWEAILRAKNTEKGKLIVIIDDPNPCMNVSVDMVLSIMSFVDRKRAKLRTEGRREDLGFVVETIAKYMVDNPIRARAYKLCVLQYYTIIGMYQAYLKRIRLIPATRRKREKPPKPFLTLTHP